MKTDNRAEASDVTPAKADWKKPEINSFGPIIDTEGNGAAGFDFASEQS
ncbi:hypothetical protein [Sphingomonas sp.]|nr:hypothetical protein [Sphingomonas sp.]